MNKTVIIVAGPTAVGKTAIALRLASALDTEIISADSRQCYRELNIGVARPSPAELATVPHHFIATHSIHDDVNAATFEAYALDKANEILQSRDTVVMAGGTGLYIKAFTDGLDSIPPIAPGIRQEIITGYNTGGISWLTRQLQQSDPLFAAQGEMLNPRRMMRALEVMLGTGQSIIELQKGRRNHRPFNIVKTAIALPREVLNKRINQRVEAMITAGLASEAQGLQPFRHLNALQTVGYSEMFDHLEGNTNLRQATDLIAQHTRQYAKRQMTWFSKDPEIQWFGPDDANALLQHVNRAQKA